MSAVWGANSISSGAPDTAGKWAVAPMPQWNAGDAVADTVAGRVRERVLDGPGLDVEGMHCASCVNRIEGASQNSYGRHYCRVSPWPSTTNFWVVRPSRPTGPRA